MITIDIGENCPGGKLRRTCDATGGGDVLEPPAAEVEVEGVVAIEPAEVNVAQAVAVVITERDARAVQ